MNRYVDLCGMFQAFVAWVLNITVFSSSPTHDRRTHYRRAEHPEQRDHFMINSSTESPT